MSDTYYEARNDTTEEIENEQTELIEISLFNVANQFFKPSYNIPPTRTALIIYQTRASNKEHEINYTIESLGFGLVPSWAQPRDSTPVVRNGIPGLKFSKELQKYHAKHFNCRKETLENKSSVWNTAKSKRCVVPIQGYFEWLSVGKEKTPYFIHSPNTPLLYLAGLYSHNTNYKVNNLDDRPYLSTFTIITGPATKNDLGDLSWLHARKPIMLVPGSKDWHDWLNSNHDWSDKLLSTCLNTTDNKAYADLVGHIVSDDVGRASAEGEYLIEKKRNAKSPQKPISHFFKPGIKRRKLNDEEIKQEKKVKKEKTDAEDPFWQSHNPKG